MSIHRALIWLELFVTLKPRSAALCRTLPDLRSSVLFSTTTLPHLQYASLEGVLVLEPATGPSSTPDPRRRPTAHNTRTTLYRTAHCSIPGGGGPHAMYGAAAQGNVQRVRVPISQLKTWVAKRSALRTHRSLGHYRGSLAPPPTEDPRKLGLSSTSFTTLLL